MTTERLARRMWWVGISGWVLMAAAGIYWALSDLVLIDAGGPVVILLTLLLGGSFLAGLASAWFAWFALLTDRILDRGSGLLSRWTLLPLLGLLLSPAIMVLVLKSVGGSLGPGSFALAWIAVLAVLAACFGWLRQWIAGYSRRTA